jgi:hypothetical protein
MKAKQFFETEKIPETNFEKIPEGMTYMKYDSLTIEITENKFDDKKQRYLIKFENKKEEQKEYEVGISIIRGIEKAIEKMVKEKLEVEYFVLTRQGTTREDTHYAVSVLE